MDIEEGDDAMDIDDPVPVTPIIERKLNDFPTDNSDLDTSVLHNAVSNLGGTPKSSRSEDSESRASAPSIGNATGTDLVCPSSEPSIVILDDEDEQSLNVSSTSGQNLQKTATQEVGIEDKQNRCFNKECKGMSSQFIYASDICLAFFRVQKDENKRLEICCTCYAYFIKNNKSPALLNAKPVKDVIDLVDKPKNSSRCINTNCKGKSLVFIYAPDFCLSYFRLKKSPGNKDEICMDCYEQSVIDNDKLAASLVNGGLLFKVDFPIINETLQIDDSDEEDEGEDQEEEYIPNSNIEFIAASIDSILLDTIDKFGIRNHIEKERNYLKERADNVENNCKDLSRQVTEIRDVLDNIQLDLYNRFRPEFRHLKGIMILDDFSLSPTLQIRPENNAPPDVIARKNNRSIAKPNEQEDSSVPSPMETAPTDAGIVEIPKDLPISSLVDKPAPQIDGLYYIAKENNIQGCWIKARLQQIIQPNTTCKGQLYQELSYRLIELKQQKERIVSGKYIAYINSCKSRLTVGTRVISAFKETNRTPATNIPRADPYYAGIVGENPVESNLYRYLIFFDIGYAQYVTHTGINLVFEADSQVWNDMPEDSRPFIQKYLESQDRPMVKLTPGQTVRVEYNGKWWLCTIKCVDCSLVQVYFDQINRWEWIYRGSTRLSPMYREELAASTRHTGIRTPRKLGPNESAAVVQYSRNEEFVGSAQKENTPPTETRAVARKSTTRPNSVPQPAPKAVRFLPPIQQTQNTSGPTSKIMCAVCKANLEPNSTRWFCNGPLSPSSTAGQSGVNLSEAVDKNKSERLEEFSTIYEFAEDEMRSYDSKGNMSESITKLSSCLSTSVNGLDSENNVPVPSTSILPVIKLETINDIYAMCEANIKPYNTQLLCNRPLSPSSVGKYLTNLSETGNKCKIENDTELACVANDFYYSVAPFNSVGSSKFEFAENTVHSNESKAYKPESIEKDLSPLSTASIQVIDSEIDDDRDRIYGIVDGSLEDPDYTVRSSDKSSSETGDPVVSNMDGRSNEQKTEGFSPWYDELDFLYEEDNTKNIIHNEDPLGIRKASGENRRGKKKKDFCFYCESYVLNFARHIQRNHRGEFVVQKIFSLRPGSVNRRKLLTNLRKKGNFLMSNNIQKSVRTGTTSEVLPCTHCRGFYSRKQLWRHRKTCVGAKGGHQTAGQNLLLKHLGDQVDKDLIETVFPRMRPDVISLTAKRDILICAYGARYLKTHREKHCVNVTSRKMRELARLLIEVQKQNSSINNLFGALKPRHFDLLVAATKIVAQYNAAEDRYESASTALNMRTNIKQCCEIALKRKSVFGTVTAANAEADLKSLIKIIESHWRFDVASQASNGFSVKKWDELTLVSFASDLMKLRDYLILKANSAVASLKTDSPSKSAFITLLETIYCRMLLLNRGTPGELQRLPLYLYENNSVQSQNYEESTDVISPSGKFLLRKFKTILIRGTRGRGVPVLFSQDVQVHIKIILEHRDRYMTRSNIFLFGEPGTSHPMYGYRVIRKYAEACGASNPDAITATRLRKHLAILTQVLNMSENDIEQLSSFMGHTVGTHRGSHRLPDDVFQTAKIFKLLLLMEKGAIASEYQGKPLDEINICLEIDADEESDEENKEALFQEVENTYSRDLNEGEGSACLTVPVRVRRSRESRSVQGPKKQTSTVGKKSKRILIPWTEEQKLKLREHFSGHIRRRNAPKRLECEVLKAKYPGLFDNKDWLKIKVCVQNLYSKKLSNT